MNKKPELSVRNDRAYYLDETDGGLLSIPASDSLGIIEMREMPVIEDSDIYRREIENPGYGMSIAKLVKERHARSVSIIISDATREVPTHLVAPFIIKELIGSGIDISQILFVVALGVHREATEKEISKFIGEEYYGQVRVENHRPFDASSVTELGITSAGTPVEVYTNAYECDLHICIGKVEPHCFAGFSGGRKSVLPGISSSKTIAANHTAEKISHACSIPGVLDNNVVHLDMLEAAKMYRIDFSVNFVLNDSLKPAGVFAGGLEEAHIASVEFLRRYCEVRITEKPDIIVSSTGRPKNIDFYQAINSLVALMPILTSDITVVLLCECREGVNSVDMMIPFQATDTIEELEHYMLSNYTIQMDATLLLLKLLKCGIKIIVSSQNVSDEEFKLMHITPCQDQDNLMELAYRMCGKEHPKVLFYPHPQKGLPVAEY